MKAIGYYQSLPIANPESLQDLDIPAPRPEPHDLLVRVRAISVNPVDTKVRMRAAGENGQPKVLGYDAVGTVEALGAQVQGFAVGDRVYYAGSIVRPGANSELHVVDARIAAKAPTSLDDAQAAALPLTTITAWELLFDRLGVPQGGGAGQTLLITGGAGGVGSILIQLARTLTQLRIVATASREETRAWCLELGAHVVIDHSKPLAQELRAQGIEAVDMVASLTQTQQHYAQIIESLKPFGQIAVIDDLPVLDAMPLKVKCISLHWEMMFTRSRFGTPDMAEQGKLLAAVAAMVDAGRIRSTANTVLGRIDAANLRKAHALIETGTAKGKVVLAGF